MSLTIRNKRLKKTRKYKKGGAAAEYKNDTNEFYEQPDDPPNWTFEKGDSYTSEDQFLLWYLDVTNFAEKLRSRRDSSGYDIFMRCITEIEELIKILHDDTDGENITESLNQLTIQIDTIDTMKLFLLKTLPDMTTFFIRSSIELKISIVRLLWALGIKFDDSSSLNADKYYGLLSTVSNKEKIIEELDAGLPYNNYAFSTLLERIKHEIPRYKIQKHEFVKRYFNTYRFKIFKKLLNDTRKLVLQADPIPPIPYSYVPRMDALNKISTNKKGDMLIALGLAVLNPTICKESLDFFIQDPADEVDITPTDFKEWKMIMKNKTDDLTLIPADITLKWVLPEIFVGVRVKHLEILDQQKFVSIFTYLANEKGYSMSVLKKSFVRAIHIPFSYLTLNEVAHVKFVGNTLKSCFSFAFPLGLNVGAHAIGDFPAVALTMTVTGMGATSNHELPKKYTSMIPMPGIIKIFGEISGTVPTVFNTFESPQFNLATSKSTPKEKFRLLFKILKNKNTAIKQMGGRAFMMYNADSSFSPEITRDALKTYYNNLFQILIKNISVSYTKNRLYLGVSLVGHHFTSAVKSEIYYAMRIVYKILIKKLNYDNIEAFSQRLDLSHTYNITLFELQEIVNNIRRDGCTDESSRNILRKLLKNGLITEDLFQNINYPSVLANSNDEYDPSNPRLVHPSYDVQSFIDHFFEFMKKYFWGEIIPEFTKEQSEEIQKIVIDAAKYSDGEHLNPQLIDTSIEVSFATHNLIKYLFENKIIFRRPSEGSIYRFIKKMALTSYAKSKKSMESRVTAHTTTNPFNKFSFGLPEGPTAEASILPPSSYGVPANFGPFGSIPGLSPDGPRNVTEKRPRNNGQANNGQAKKRSKILPRGRYYTFRKPMNRKPMNNEA